MEIGLTLSVPHGLCENDSFQKICYLALEMNESAKKNAISAPLILLISIIG